MTGELLTVMAVGVMAVLLPEFVMLITGPTHKNSPSIPAMLSVPMALPPTKLPAPTADNTPPDSASPIAVAPFPNA